MKKNIFVFILAISLILPNFVLAVAPSSESFNITGGEVVPTAGSGSSENFQVNLSSGSETGNPSSESFSVTGGSSVPQTTDNSDDGQTETVNNSNGGSGIGQTNGDVINLTNVKIFNLSTSTAKISFDTDTLAVAYIRFGENTQFNLETGKEESYLLNHNFVLSGLKFATNYSFVIYLINRQHNEIFSQVFSFKTLPIINFVDNNTDIQVNNPFLDTNQEQEFVPVKTTEVNNDLVPVDSKDTLEVKYTNVFDLYNVTPQYVDKNFIDLVENFKKLPKDTIDGVNALKPGLVDDFGVLQQNVYESLSFDEKKSIEEITGLVLPIENDIEKINITVGDRKEIAKVFGADWYSLPDSQLFFSLDSSLLNKKVSEIIVSIENNTYSLTKNEGSGNYEGFVTVPSKSARYEVLSRITYADDTYEDVHNSLFVDKYGFVYASKSAPFDWSKPWQFLTQEKIFLSNTKIILEQKNEDGTWSIWSQHSDNVYNPAFTDVSGRFAFFVDNGTYRLHVYNQDFGDKFSKEYQVDNGIFNFNVEIASSNSHLLFFSFTLFIICGIIIAKFIFFRKI